MFDESVIRAFAWNLLYAEALVAAARRLASDKTLRSHMAESGREAARTRFSRKANAEQALRCLDAAVSAFPREKGR